MPRVWFGDTGDARILHIQIPSRIVILRLVLPTCLRIIYWQLILFYVIFYLSLVFLVLCVTISWWGCPPSKTPRGLDLRNVMVLPSIYLR